MKRGRRPPADARQPDLFAQHGAAWITNNWPHWARATHNDFDTDPYYHWAMTFHDVSAGAKVLVTAFCAQVATTGACKASVPTMASWTGASVKATRSRLDKLLQAGIILVKPWTEQAARGAVPLGYEIRLMIDEDVRERALDEGFSDLRLQRPREVQQ